MTADVNQLTGEQRMTPAMPDRPYRLIDCACRQQRCEEGGNLNR
jgi:hypothetical protein